MKIFAVLLLLMPLAVFGEGLRVLPKGTQPADSRLEPLRDLNGYFPFTPPASAEEWKGRAEKLRHHTRVACGLYPEPTRNALNPVVHGRVEREGFSTEKVILETLPGFFLTGTLYRPLGEAVKNSRPGVLCPHGHWNEARFYDAGEGKGKEQVEKGAEVDVEAARNPIQSRCVQLARMGCVVFQYDMLGYCDNDQISFDLAHKFGKQRPEMIAEKNWGLYSPQAESHLQGIVMLQTWNSVRGLDFLEGLSDVDPKRLAVTGASGGGTQTMLLAALDERVAVSMPAVMVSTSMQGGCTCENSTLLRVREGNVGFAALFAPKPQCVTNADDWTKEMATKGFPELKDLYKTLGVPGRVKLHDRTEFKHNYNLEARRSLYAWFNEHLELDAPAEMLKTEKPWKRLVEEDLTVWDSEHPKPKAGDADFERGLLAQLEKDLSGKISDEVAANGWEVVLDAEELAGEREQVVWELLDKVEEKGHFRLSGLIEDPNSSVQLPAVFLYPTEKEWSGRAVIWVSEQGKAGLFEKGGTVPVKAVADLLASGHSVAAVDLFQQGEFLAEEGDWTEARRVKNTREVASYTQGYNRALFVERAHDLVRLVHFIRDDEHGAKQIDMVALGKAGHWAAAARFLTEEDLGKVVIEESDFSFGKVMAIRDPDFLPGGSRYGDLERLLKLGAQDGLTVLPKGEAFDSSAF